MRETQDRFYVVANETEECWEIRERYGIHAGGYAEDAIIAHFYQPGNFDGRLLADITADVLNGRLGCVPDRDAVQDASGMEEITEIKIQCEDCGTWVAGVLIHYWFPGDGTSAALCDDCTAKRAKAIPEGGQQADTTA